MEIPSILPPDNGAQPAPGGSLSGAQSLGEQDFLLMLITQLSNQDPLNPMEGTEFASQLAQFTSVEQLLSLNETLGGRGETFNLLAETMGESLLAQGDMLFLLADSLNRSAATSLIGMSVDVPGNLVPWNGDTAAPMIVELDAPAATLHVTLRDENGETVQTFTLEGVEAGRHELIWDGLDAEGNPLPEGVYTFEVQAFDEAGSLVGAMPLMNGTVDRVSFGPDGVRVWVNGQAVPYAEIRSIGASGETTAGQTEDTESAAEGG